MFQFIFNQVYDLESSGAPCQAAGAPHAGAYSSEMMRFVRAVHSALARSMSMPGHAPSR